jgi:Lon protease-like protein
MKRNVETPLSKRILNFRGSVREEVDRKLVQIADSWESQEELSTDVETRLNAVLTHLMRAVDEAVAAEADLSKLLGSQSQYLLMLIEKARQERVREQ